MGHVLQLSIELIATAAFALSGVMEAARKKLDAVGVCVVGFLCAFGGGTLRDLLLDQRPFFWVKHVEVLWGVFALCLLTMLFLRPQHFRVTASDSMARCLWIGSKALFCFIQFLSS